MTAEISAAGGPWPWELGEAKDRRFPLRPLRRGAKHAARALLGACLFSEVDGCRTGGVIVETEAYVGPEDPASHASQQIGKTRRNAAMFGEAGTFYVYRSHGIHHCVNVVTNPGGFPAAVLVRALHPLEGLTTMAERRGRKENLCAGPGNLAKALGITRDLDQTEHQTWGLQLLEGWSVPDDAVATSGRIGISKGVDLQLRFFVRGHGAVKAPRW